MDEGQCGEPGGSWNTKSDTIQQSRPEGGVEAGYQEDVVGIRTLVNGLGALF